MARKLAIAGLCFSTIVIGLGITLTDSQTETLLGAGMPSAHRVALMISAMTFAVAAFIDQDR